MDSLKYLHLSEIGLVDTDFDGLTEREILELIASMIEPNNIIKLAAEGNTNMERLYGISGNMMITATDVAVIFHINTTWLDYYHNIIWYDGTHSDGLRMGKDGTTIGESRTLAGPLDISIDNMPLFHIEVDGVNKGAFVKEDVGDNSEVVIRTNDRNIVTLEHNLAPETMLDTRQAVNYNPNNIMELYEDTYLFMKAQGGYLHTQTRSGASPFRTLMRGIMNGDDNVYIGKKRTNLNENNVAFDTEETNHLTVSYSISADIISTQIDNGVATFGTEPVKVLAFDSYNDFIYDFVVENTTPVEDVVDHLSNIPQGSYVIVLLRGIGGTGADLTSAGILELSTQLGDFSTLGTANVVWTTIVGGADIVTEGDDGDKAGVLKHGYKPPLKHISDSTYMTKMTETDELYDNSSVTKLGLKPSTSYYVQIPILTPDSVDWKDSSYNSDLFIETGITGQMLMAGVTLTTSDILPVDGHLFKLAPDITGPTTITFSLHIHEVVDTDDIETPDTYTGGMVDIRNPICSTWATIIMKVKNIRVDPTSNDAVLYSTGVGPAGEVGETATIAALPADGVIRISPSFVDPAVTITNPGKPYGFFSLSEHLDAIDKGCITELEWVVIIESDLDEASIDELVTKIEANDINVFSNVKNDLVMNQKTVHLQGDTIQTDISLGFTQDFDVDINCRDVRSTYSFGNLDFAYQKFVVTNSETLSLDMSKFKSENIHTLNIAGCTNVTGNFLDLPNITDTLDLSRVILGGGMGNLNMRKFRAEDQGVGLYGSRVALHTVQEYISIRGSLGHTTVSAAETEPLSPNIHYIDMTDCAMSPTDNDKVLDLLAFGNTSTEPIKVFKYSGNRTTASDPSLMLLEIAGWQIIQSISHGETYPDVEAAVVTP